MHLQKHVELDRTTGPLGRVLKKFIERISGKGRIEEELGDIWSRRNWLVRERLRRESMNGPSCFQLPSCRHLALGLAPSVHILHAGPNRKVAAALHVLL